MEVYELLITRLRPYINTVSEQLKNKNFGDTVVVGGAIQYVIPPVIPSFDDDTYGIMMLDDSVGESCIVLTDTVYEKYKQFLGQDEVVLVKGRVMMLKKCHGIKELDTEYRVIATGIVPLTSAEERSNQDG